MNIDWLNWIDRWLSLTVLVIGDVMLDCYLHGASHRLCQEAPVPVVAIEQRQDFPGGAANSAANVAALGAKVKLLSVIGQDGEGDRLRQALQQRSVNANLMTTPHRTTLSKQRIVAQNQLLLRFDQGSTEPIDAALEAQFINQLTQDFLACDAVIVSDYGYGILTPRIIQTIADLQSQHPRTVIVDAKQLTAYQAVKPTIVKPNYQETIQLLGLAAQTEQRVEQILPYGDRLLELSGATMVAATLDREGVLLFQPQQPPIHQPAKPVPSHQTSGAGDTFVSALTLSLAAQIPVSDALSLASTATAIVVQQPGTSICSIEQLRQSILSECCLQKQMTDRALLAACIQLYRASGRKVVFTNGCFDILHAGHVTYLEQAKALGDILIVGVNSDESVRQLKGIGRPVNALTDRLTVLAALGCVDHVVPFSESTPHHLIQIVCPDVFVKGGDYTRNTLPEADLVESLGGVVKILPFVNDRSTTNTIAKIRSFSKLPPSHIAELP
ncbi:MAG TPA: D-glycero-beta-D-manno-heptose 1-phosphate adenylyltransferase [Trichocoleus sp.]|jgi:D-beta-D-heptose 7-phosphate kinase/D-beta-D-heptose 1-phosphate adenosyltransferase